MSNMGYCRWENTSRDLSDCLSSLDNGEYPSSDLEKIACNRLFETFLGWCVDQGIIDEWYERELALAIEGEEEIF